jgi:hypothetical protein
MPLTPTATRSIRETWVPSSNWRSTTWKRSSPAPT